MAEKIVKKEHQQQQIKTYETNKQTTIDQKLQNLGI